MAENKDLVPNNAQNAAKADDGFRCKAARSLDTCGKAVLFICVIVAIIMALYVIEEIVNSQPTVLAAVFSTLGVFLGGCIIESVLCGFAVIVEAHYRKYTQG